MSKITRKVPYKGVDFDVTFIFIPEEPEVRYYPDGSGYPGSPAEVEIHEIFHKGTDFTVFLQREIIDIEAIILENLGDDTGGEEDSEG